jgi:hypothetical protein
LTCSSEKNAANNESWEINLRGSRPISPHPQPLSPEYQGEGGTEHRSGTLKVNPL